MSSHRPRRPNVRTAATAVITLLLGGCSMWARRPPPVTPAPVPEPTPLPAPTTPPVAPVPGVPPPPADIDSIPDAVPRYEPRSAHGNPPFYTVLGRRYVVLGSADGYLQRGVASWYGPTFHGGSTSSGDPYDMYAMTGAHKTLPLPCYARVTNLSNGRSVVVRINDRGPFVANRLIDLSYTAAAKLDMIRNGTALVEVRTLTPGEPDNLTRSSASPPPTLYLQAGAFAEPGNAQRLQARLSAAGIGHAFVLSPINASSHLYRVRVGPIASVAAYDQLAAQLATLGIEARLAND